MAAKYRATRDFGSVLMHNGENVKVDFVEGWEGGLPEWQVELLAANCPGALVEVKATKSQPKVETKAGPLTDSATRQVTAAPKRTRKTKAAKK